MNPITNHVYVANFGNGASPSTVTVIDAAHSNATSTVNVGAGPQAVAVNVATNRIYVVNYGDGVHARAVTVIDGATGNTTAVTVGVGPQAVAVNRATNKVYVSNGVSNSLTVIDEATQGTTELNVGTNPEAVSVNPVTNRIYVANAGSKTVTVIDANNNNAATTVNVGTSPSAIVVDAMSNRIYVTNSGSNNVTVIDGATNNTSALAVGEDPDAVNPVTNKIYVANAGNYGNIGTTVTVIDGATNSTSTVTVSPEPIAVAVNAVTNKIYVSSPEGGSYDSGIVTVIDGATNSTSTVTVGVFGSNAVAVNPVTNKIYVANASSKNVTVIDGATNTTITVSAKAYPTAVAVNPVTNKIYVVNVGGSYPDYQGTVTVIDGATNRTSTVTVGNYPDAVAVNPVTNKIYVTNQRDDTVTVIDGATNSTTTVTAGSGPRAVAVKPVTNKIYVTNSGINTVTVIDGATNNTSTVSTGNSPWAAAVNPVTNKIYQVNADGSATVIAEQQVQDIPLNTAITPLDGNQTTSSTPTFSFTAESSFGSGAPAVENVFYQVDTWQGEWLATTNNGGGNFSGTTPPLQPGFHILYAYATDGQEATSTITGRQTSLLVGNITAYGFLVLASLPDMTITKTHSGDFTQGQTGATYTITASNSGNLPTNGTVTVTDTLPTGLTATAMSGSGWTCTLGTLTCTRSDALNGGSSYPAIMVTVNVANNALASVTNTATVAGGGEANTSNDTANNPTTILQLPTADSVTPNAATGPDQMFSLQYSVHDPGKSYTDLTWVYVRGSLETNGCEARYTPGSNGLYLLNDGATAWLGPLAPGSAGTLANSQCTLNGTGSSASGSGATLTLNLSLSATSTFVGTQQLTMAAQDSEGSKSGWQQRGTWTPAADTVPTADSVTPQRRHWPQPDLHPEVLRAQRPRLQRPELGVRAG